MNVIIDHASGLAAAITRVGRRAARKAYATPSRIDYTDSGADGTRGTLIVRAYAATYFKLLSPNIATGGLTVSAADCDGDIAANTTYFFPLSDDLEPVFVGDVSAIEIIGGQGN